jgi:diguanylate cyclase (GGDEF)-like protein/PAS domain S-box-containing protein
VHVLVAEHNPERARSLQAALSAAGHRAELVTTGGAALAALARPGAPDLVLVEERMTDMTALDFLQAAVRMSVGAPVVVLGDDEDAARWVEGTRLGAVDFVVIDPDGAYLATLAARLHAARRRTGERDASARLADALASTSAAVMIADRTGRVEYANAACARLLGRKAGDAARGTLADVFPLEDEPRLKADLFAAIQVGGEWAGEVPVLTGQGERVPCIVTLSPIRRSQGRTDGLVLTLRDVSERVAIEDALRAANRRLAEQASRDPLTRLYNRGYFHEVLEREIARAVRYGDELAVLMVDQDDFKRINDVQGHGVGDSVLCEVGGVLGDGLRDGDVLARYGGDEFCVLLPNTGRDAARRVAERLASLVRERAFGPHRDLRIHVSIGLATSRDVPSGEKVPADRLLGIADRSLLAAKRQGGDRVIAHGDPGATD